VSEEELARQFTEELDRYAACDHDWQLNAVFRGGWAKDRWISECTKCGWARYHAEPPEDRPRRKRKVEEGENQDPVRNDP
jgi:hypothetical protein